MRFCIKEKVLTVEDLDRIWSTQDGKHEIIVKNIHDLLVKLAWDFSPDQLDHLFGCFQVCAVGNNYSVHAVNKTLAYCILLSLYMHILCDSIIL